MLINLKKLSAILVGMVCFAFLWAGGGPRKVVLISAIPEEAAPSIEVLQDKGFDVEYVCIGVGPLNATVNRPVLSQKVVGEYAIYIGTAGTFAPRFDQPYLVTTALKTYWMPTGERCPTQRLCPPKDTQYKIGPLTSDLEKLFIISSPGPSLIAEISQAVPLPPAQNLVENMNFYTIADILNFAPTCDVLIGFTNEGSPDGHTQWLENRKRAAEMTAEHIRELL